jgi:hypothetical protein
VCWSIAVEEKPTAGSPLFGTFPSDRIPKATKDDKVHFFRHSFTVRDGLMMGHAWQSKRVNYTSEFRGSFEATTCKYRRQKQAAWFPSSD